MPSKGSKFYIIILLTPREFLSKENFNTTRNQNTYSEIE